MLTVHDYMFYRYMVPNWMVRYIIFWKQYICTLWLLLTLHKCYLSLLHIQLLHILRATILFIKIE